MSNPRYVAAKALMRVEKDSAYSNIVINEAISAAKLNRLDAAFATSLFYGVLERKHTLDFIIDRLSSRHGRISPLVHEVLRCGIFQILYMDKVPASAAVNESVKIVKSSKESRASGYVNALLRGVIRECSALPKEKTAYGLSVRCSCNEDLVRLYINDYGYDETERFLTSALSASDIYIRVNTLKNSAEELTELFKKLNIEAVRTEKANCLKLIGVGDIERNPLYNEGRFHVQDVSSQLCAEALCAQKGQSVLDLCAAPGGKSFTVCEQMQNTGRVVSCDIHRHRVELLAEGAERLGLDAIEPTVADAAVYNADFASVFDRVLCDVPCSGSGVIGRKPDIKYKNFDNLNELSDLQYKILENGFKYLKIGGRLVYSTCSILKAENENVVNGLLKSEESARLLSMRTFLPQTDGTDGFFVAVIEK